MFAVTPYISFPDGKCKAALKFYQEVLGAEIFKDKDGKEELMLFAGSDMETPENKELIMHVHFKVGDAHIMASDVTDSSQVLVGTNITLGIGGFKDKAQVDQVFTALSAGGTVIMPLSDQFWGAYFGILKDKFDIQWMFSFDY